MYFVIGGYILWVLVYVLLRMFSLENRLSLTIKGQTYLDCTPVILTKTTHENLQN